MAGGRPLKIKSNKILQKRIDAYFENCKKNDIPLTITGLGLAVNLSRQQLIEYAQKPEFHDTIKKAKQIIENDYEIALRKNGRAGEIFALKNFGWTDRQELTGADNKPLFPVLNVTINRD